MGRGSILELDSGDGFTTLNELSVNCILYTLDKTVNVMLCVFCHCKNN